jgi:hypothetical protein
MKWVDRVESFLDEPISAEFKLRLTYMLREIETGIVMRGGESVSDDECMALLTIRNYLEQCEEVIPTQKQTLFSDFEE